MNIVTGYSDIQNILTDYKKLRSEGLGRDKAVEQLSKKYYYSNSYIIKLLTKARKAG